MDPQSEKPDTDRGIETADGSEEHTNVVHEPVAVPDTATEAEAVIVDKEKKFDPDLISAVILPKHIQAALDSATSWFHESDAAVPDVEVAGADVVAPRAPLLVFFNSKSGGRMGPALSAALNDLIGSSQVFDLSKDKPVPAITSALKCLSLLAEKGDKVAEESLKRLRILVAGGDGTVGWILSSLAHVDSQIIPPVGVIPLGTGNDLARSFGWGPGFTSASLEDVKKRLLEGADAIVTHLDGWKITVNLPAGTDPAVLTFPHAMQHISGEEGAPSVYAATFYNYFSLGMDAKIAHGFHHLREKKPWLATGGVVNKVIYSSFGCTQGWFCASCSPNPQRRSVSGVATIFIKKTNESEWEELYVPFTLRSIIILNLQSYGGGRNLWRSPPAELVEKNGWVTPSVDDGLLEIVGLHDGWHAMVAMGGLTAGVRLAQAAAVKFELRGNQRKEAFLQLDGEPWSQPLLDPAEETVVEISRIPNKSILLATPDAQVLKKAQ